MENLVIVGGGGNGREILEWIKDINQINPIWNVLGFIDDNLNVLKEANCDFKVIGKINEWERFEDVYFAMGIANPVTKEIVSKNLLEKGAKFASIIHPSVRIAENASYGQGMVAYPGAYLCSNTRVGNFVTLLSSKISHDCIIRDYCTILSYCGVNGNTTLGKRVFVGNHATIVQGKKIEDDVNIGIGSVVLTDLEKGVHVFGNPARIFKKGE